MKNYRWWLSTLFAAGAMLMAGRAGNLAAAELPGMAWDQGSAISRPLESIGAGFKALDLRTSAERAERSRLEAVEQPQDVLLQVSACAIVDAKTFVPYTMDGALKALQPCLQALGRRYSAAIRAEQGMIGINGGHGAAVGIQIRVPESPAGGRALTELGRSVRDLRHGSLMGFPADVLAAGPKGRMAERSAEPYGVPSWIDGRSLRIDEKQTRLSGADGSLHVVLFDKDDGEVELNVPPSSVSDGKATVDFVKADDSEAGPYTLESVKASEPGALGRLVAEAVVPAGLDARTRAAVQGLFDHLRG